MIGRENLSVFSPSRDSGYSILLFRLENVPLQDYLRRCTRKRFSVNVYCVHFHLRLRGVLVSAAVPLISLGDGR